MAFNYINIILSASSSSSFFKYFKDKGTFTTIKGTTFSFGHYICIKTNITGQQRHTFIQNLAHTLCMHSQRPTTNCVWSAMRNMWLYLKAQCVSLWVSGCLRCRQEGLVPHETQSHILLKHRELAKCNQARPTGTQL